MYGGLLRLDRLHPQGTAHPLGRRFLPLPAAPDKYRLVDVVHDIRSRLVVKGFNLVRRLHNHTSGKIHGTESGNLLVKVRNLAHIGILVLEKSHMVWQAPVKHVLRPVIQALK